MVQIFKLNSPTFGSLLTLRSTSFGIGMPTTMSISHFTYIFNKDNGACNGAGVTHRSTNGACTKRTPFETALSVAPFQCGRAGYVLMSSVCETECLSFGSYR